MEQKEGETDTKDKPDTAATSDIQPVVQTIEIQNPSNEAFLKAINEFSAGRMKKLLNIYGRAPISYVQNWQKQKE
ncbi:MAG: hypothetical protein ACOYVG_05195 [Bacteroidota bacterium]